MGHKDGKGLWSGTVQVEANDLGNNFLLDSNSLGKSRAQCVTELLKELNPSVHGSFVEDSAAKLLETTPDFFTGFQLVVATQVRHLLLLLWQVIHFTRGNNAAHVLARFTSAWRLSWMQSAADWASC